MKRTDSLWDGAFNPLIMAAVLFAAISVASSVGYWNDEFPFQYVMDELQIVPSQIVADVGCAEGFFTFDLAKRVGKEGQVWAVDIDQAALDQVRKKNAEKKLAQIKIILGTPNDPKLPKRLFDVVIIANAFHEMENYDEMLQAIWRALKPNGILAIIDNAPGWLPPVHAIAEETVVKRTAQNGFRLHRKVPALNGEKETNFFFLTFRP